jgi:uncharacterized protein (DUF4415 family)
MKKDRRKRPLASEANGRKRVLEITQKDYEADIARGVDPKDALKPGKHVFRRGSFFKRHGVTAEQMKDAVRDAKTPKVAMTMRIDADVLEFFKQRAAESGAPGYQTQINDVLRAFMEKSEKMPAGAAALLENETFLAAVAEKIRERTKITA